MKHLILGSITAVIMVTLVCLSAGLSALNDQDVSGDAPMITMEELNFMLGNPNLVIIDSPVSDRCPKTARHG